MKRISQWLAHVQKGLIERYEIPLPRQSNGVKLFENRIEKYLEMIAFILKTQ